MLSNTQALAIAAVIAFVGLALAYIGTADPNPGKHRASIWQRAGRRFERYATTVLVMVRYA